MTEEKTPKQIVELLDKYIIGQNEAKKYVAVALYNRYRRLQLPKQMQQDITPKNMLMAGPTGVGKTEIARRLAKIVDAPFVKVEATKFTEVGYVGRDVESMVRDLVEEAVRMEEKEQFDRVKVQATKKANNRLVKLIVPGIKRENRENSMQQMMQMLSGNFNMNQAQDNEEVTDDIRNERLSVADQLNKGLLENREVTIEVEQAPKVNPMGDMMGQMGIDMSSLMGDLMPKKTVKRTLKVSDAREVLIQEESKKLINYDSLYQRAIERTQQNGIIFIDEIDAVGHRMVHGGEKFSSSVIITEDVIKDIESCNDLAPLHNPANILGVRACQEVMPGVKHVAVFDTAFHQTMPAKAYLYALPKEYYEKYGVRRYGFHGTSHSFVSKRLAELAGLDYNNSKMIICHIGSGASISAIKDGKSIDTSMGMTPLEGLVMGTRSGDIDPAIIEFICQKENISVSEMTTILNKKSGVLGLSGVSNDFRDLVDARESGNKDAANAIDVLVYRIVKYIGAYYMALGGVDAIALTAGAGENNKEVREMIMEGISALGVKIDEKANQTRGEEILLSTKDSKVPVWIVPTNEELAIARETARLVK